MEPESPQKGSDRMKGKAGAGTEEVLVSDQEERFYNESYRMLDARPRGEPGLGSAQSSAEQLPRASSSKPALLQGGAWPADLQRVPPVCIVHDYGP